MPCSYLLAHQFLDAVPRTDEREGRSTAVRVLDLPKDWHRWFPLTTVGKPLWEAAEKCFVGKPLWEAANQ